MYRTDLSKIERLSTEPYEFKFSEYFSKGWWIFQQKPAEFIAYTLLVSVIIGAVSFIPLASLVLSPPLTAGYYLVSNQISRGEAVRFNDFFKGFDYIGQLIVVSLIGGLLTIVGLIFLVIPGIYLAVGYTFANQLVLFEKMEFWDALEGSRKVVTNNWLVIFAFVLVAGLLAASGLIIFCVGVLVTIPIAACASYAAFEDVFELNIDKPKDDDLLNHLIP